MHPSPRARAGAIARGGAGRDPFAALADPTRRAILDGLRGSARTAGDIASDFSISRPGVSKHLRVLAGAGLVRVVKHGRERHYYLEAAPLAGVDAWVGRYRLLWAARLMSLKEYVENSPPDAPGTPGAGFTPPTDSSFS
jgi:DNA-binding transcriptional ArsR family regulator